MINKITNLNKHWVVDQYFQEYSKDIGYQQIFEEFKKYFFRDKESYTLDQLEQDIKQNCPKLLNEEHKYASSISSSSKF